MCLDQRESPSKDLHMRLTGAREEDSIAEVVVEEENPLEVQGEKKRILKRMAMSRDVVDHAEEDEAVIDVTGLVM